MSSSPTWMWQDDSVQIDAEHCPDAVAALAKVGFESLSSGSPAEQLASIFKGAYDTEAEVMPDGSVCIYHLFDETLIDTLAEPFAAMAAFVNPGTVTFSCASDGKEGPEDFGEAFRFIFDGSPLMRITYREDEDSNWEDWKSV